MSRITLERSIARLLERIVIEASPFVHSAPRIFRHMRNSVRSPNPGLRTLPDDRLRHALTELEAVYRDAPVALAFLDTSLRYVRVNARLAQMNGVPAAEHVGRTVPDILPDIGEAVHTRLRQVLETGLPLTHIRVAGVTAATSEPREYDCSWYPVADEQGVLLGITAIIDDVTGEVNAERERNVALALAMAARARAESLQRVTAGLAVARSEREIAAVITDESTLVLDAMRCTVALVEQDQHQLRIIRPDALNADHDQASVVPLGSAMPMTDVVHRERTIALGSLADWEIQYGAEVVAQRILTGRNAALAVPCRLGHQVTAVIGLCFSGVRQFSEEDRALLEAMGAQCALALNRVQLQVSERAAQMRFRALIEQAPLGVHVIASSGESLLVNPMFERTYGMSAAEINSNQAHRSCLPDELKTLVLLQRVRAGEVVVVPPMRMERFQRADGRAPWVEGVAYPVKNDAGEVVEIVTLTNDVTTREEAAIALRDSTERTRLSETLADTLRLLEDPESIVRTAMVQLRALVHAKHMVFLEASDDEQLLHLVEDAAAPGVTPMVPGAPPVPVQSFGHDAERFSHGGVLSFADLQEEWQQRGVPEEMFRYAASQGNRAGLWVPLHQSGRLIAAIGVIMASPHDWTDEEIHFVKEQGARLTEALLRSRATRALRELTADLERRVEARTSELRVANARLAEVSARKSQFVAMMSHEIRTPLNAILGFNQLMQAGVLGPTTPHQQECLEDILASGHHLIRLVDDVLDAARVEAGRVSFRPEPVPLAAFVNECVATLQVIAKTANVSLHAECDFELDEAIYTDPGRLRQVVHNYLSNAIKWTPAGGRVTLRASRVVGHRVRFTVTDTGVGIAEAHLGRLFQEFERVEVSGRPMPGTGLGLVLARRLVEAQGGAVGVTSAEGQGSEFWAEYPAASVW